MPRPTSKAELITAASAEFQKLNQSIALCRGPVLLDIAWQAPIENQSRNTRDVLCHLYEWHRLLMGWVDQGSAGIAPEMPAPGYNWRQTPQLNADIWAKHRNTTYPEARTAVQLSHEQVMTLAEGYSNDELFNKGVFSWTRAATLGSLFISATSSHYVWAQKTIKDIRKHLP